MYVMCIQNITVLYFVRGSIKGHVPDYPCTPSPPLPQIIGSTLYLNSAKSRKFTGSISDGAFEIFH
jgi:hypothetical protein